MLKTLFISSLLLCGTVCLAQQTQEAGIKASIQQFFDGMRLADSTMVRAVVHSKCTMMTSYFDKNGNSKLRIEDNINGFIKTIGTPHPEIYDEKLTSIDIKIDDNLASVWAPYQFYLGKNFSHAGVDIFTLVNENGKWKIVAIADTRNKK
jgi:hypothetical protein